MERAISNYVYSEAFKRKVVDSVTKGELTVSKARKIYDIGGKMTIQKWIKKYGNPSFQEKILAIEKKNEVNKTKELKLQKQELESALAQAHLKILSLESMIEVISEEYGTDLESIKKKSDTKRSKKRG